MDTTLPRLYPDALGLTIEQHRRAERTLESYHRSRIAFLWLVACHWQNGTHNSFTVLGRFAYVQVELIPRGCTEKRLVGHQERREDSSHLLPETLDC